MTEDADRDAKLAAQITDIIGPMLGGLPPGIVSAVLADLTATWLAGFQGEGKEQFRKTRLKEFVALVEDLIDPNEQQIFARLLERAPTGGVA